MGLDSYFRSYPKECGDKNTVLLASKYFNSYRPDASLLPEEEIKRLEKFLVVEYPCWDYDKQHPRKVFGTLIGNIRKDYQMHDAIVKLAQKGVDDCGEYFITKETLDKICREYRCHFLISLLTSFDFDNCYLTYHGSW